MASVSHVPRSCAAPIGPHDPQTLAKQRRQSKRASAQPNSTDHEVASKHRLSTEIQTLLEKRLALEREVRDLAELTAASAKMDIQREREQLARDRSQVGPPLVRCWLL